MTNPLHSEGARLFDHALSHLAPEDRETTLDAIYCTLHNEGYGLDGNREAGDLDWFARKLYDQAPVFREGNTHWGNLDASERARWYELAKTALRLVPLLMSRMAHRCIRTSQAVKTVLDMAGRKKSKKETDQ